MKILDWRLVAGGALGAIMTGGVWAAVSWQPEPSFRHTPDYDLCLAYGRSIMACDASLRLTIAQREIDRRNEKREKREKCEAEAKAHPEAPRPDSCNPFLLITGPVDPAPRPAGQAVTKPNPFAGDLRARGIELAPSRQKAPPRDPQMEAAEKLFRDMDAKDGFKIAPATSAKPDPFAEDFKDFKPDPAGKPKAAAPDPFGEMLARDGFKPDPAPRPVVTRVLPAADDVPHISSIDPDCLFSANGVAFVTCPSGVSAATPASVAGTRAAGTARGVPGDPVYDRCMADRRNKAACDALMDTIFLKLAAMRKQMEHECLPPEERAKAGTALTDPDPMEDYFNDRKQPTVEMLDCILAVNRRLDQVYDAMSNQ